MTAYFDTALEADAFESWFFGEALAGAEWFSFALPRNGQVVQARFKDGEIGPLKPTTKTFAFSERSFELEYVRPGFRTLPLGLHSVTPAQVLQVQRASTATFVDSAGLLQTAAAHVARFTHFSGKNIYSGPVDLVAGPGVPAASHFIKTATSNPAGLQLGETITVSARVYQDAASAAEGVGKIARFFCRAATSAGVWQAFVYLDSVSVSATGRASATLTLPALASDMDSVLVGVSHGGGDGSLLGTVRADAVMVERGAVATAYEPGARLLVESAASNQALHSSAFSNAAWEKIGTISVAENATTAPDGTLTADTITFTGGVTNDRVDQAIPVVAVSGVRWTYSVWLRGSGSVHIEINTTTGVGGVSELLVNLTPNWVRYSVSVTFASPTGNVRAHGVILRSPGVRVVHVWGAQIEQSAAATSYIPTTTAPATRAADVIQVTA